MARFVSKEKLSKKAQKELNRQRRVTWAFSPVTKTVESRKVYSRKKRTRDRDEYGLGFFVSESGRAFPENGVTGKIGWFILPARFCFSAGAVLIL